jgi:hypothetical protein
MRIRRELPERKTEGKARDYELIIKMLVVIYRIRYNE